MADKMLDLLAKILNQAENAATDEEAATYMAKAQNMATTHAIDLAIARQHTAKREQREQPTMEQITIGVVGSKANKRLIHLFNAIAGQNDLRMNIAHNSTYVIAFGFPSDIEVVQALYASLAHQMVASANAYLATGAYKNERVYDHRTYAMKPMDGRVARNSFYDAFISRIGSRLREARREALQAIKDAAVTVLDEEGTEVESTGALVLVAKEVEVRDFYKQKSTARGSWKGASSTATSNHARSAGTSAANSARLGGAKSIGGSRTGIAC